MADLLAVLGFDSILHSNSDRGVRIQIITFILLAFHDFAIQQDDQKQDRICADRFHWHTRTIKDRRRRFGDVLVFVCRLSIGCGFVCELDFEKYLPVIG